MKPASRPAARSLLSWAAATFVLAAAAFSCRSSAAPTPPPSPSRSAAARPSPAASPASTSPFPLDLFPEEVGVIGADGSNRTTVTLNGEWLTGLSWTPDGRLSYTTLTETIIDGDQRELGRAYIARADGSARELLYEAPNPLAISWSPDGTWAAIAREQLYVWETPGVTLKRADGTQSIDLGAQTPPGAWLPDGRYAYVKDGQLVAGPPGTAQPILIDAPKLAGGPGLSPDGARLLLGTADSARFIVADLASGRVSAPSEDDVARTVWSPDGTRVLYATGVGNFKPDPRLWVFDATTGRSTLLERGLQHIDGYDWSPDGTRVALTVHDGDAAGLYIIDVATARWTRIARGDDMAQVAWSGDGAWIAVNRNGCWSGCEPGPESLVLVDPNSGQQVTGLAWSYQSVIGAWRAGRSYVWGGESLQLAMPDGAVSTLDDFAQSVYRFAALSPDGRTVAFGRSIAPPFHVFDVNVKTGDVSEPSLPDPQALRGQATAPPPDGATMTRLDGGAVLIHRPGTPDQRLIGLPETRGCGTSAQPLWSPGGRYLAYDSCLRGVWVADRARGQWFELARSTWCFFFYDSPAVLTWLSDDTLRVLAVPTLC